MISSKEVLDAIKNDDELVGKLKKASAEESLKDIGLDSLDILIFSHDLTEKFNADIEIYNYHTLNNIIDLVNEILLNKRKVK